MEKETMYKVVIDEITVQEETVFTYGIAFVDGEKEVKRASDISLNKDFVTEAAKQLNENDLDPINLEEIAEDLREEDSSL